MSYKPYTPRPLFTGNLTPLPHDSLEEPYIRIYIINPFTNTFELKTVEYYAPLSTQSYPTSNLNFIKQLDMKYICSDVHFCLFQLSDLLLLTGALPSELVE